MAKEHSSKTHVPHVEEEEASKKQGKSRFESQEESMTGRIFGLRVRGSTHGA
jgi:hypothetical protein